MTKNDFNAVAVLLASTFLTTPLQAADITDFSQLQNALTNGGNYTLGADINATAALGTLTSALTLDGAGFGIDGGNTVRGLTVADGATLNLSNIGSSTSASGFSGFSYNIKNTGTVNLNNIYVTNNNLTDGTPVYGGIIQNSGNGIISIDNSVFDGNTQSSNRPSLWGGIIANGNTSAGQENNSAAQITHISNTTFKNNIANTADSAVGAPHGAVILNQATIGTIQNVTFENNVMFGREDSWGGAHGTAIDNNEYGTINLITDSKFINNKTYRTGKTVYTDGRNYHASAAAIDNYNRIGTIQNSLFQGNAAESEASSVTGGAMMLGRLDGSAPNQGDGIVDRIDNSIFSGNYVKNTLQGSGNGGAIAQWGTLNHLTNSVFENNYVSTVNGLASGGAINNSYIIGEIDNVSFKGNYVQSDVTQAIGGAMRNYGTIPVINNVTFSGNHTYASNYSTVGGALAHSGATAEIGQLTNVVFENNYTLSDTSTARGGAFISATKVGNMENVVFKNNYAKGAAYARGGAFYNTGEIDNIVNASFIGNYVEGDDTSTGGAIYSATALNIVAENADSIFSGNKANGTGNDIYMKGTQDAPIALNLSANNGTISFDGGLDGAYYNVNVSGNGTLELATAVKNAATLTAVDTTLRLRKGQFGQGTIEGDTSLTLKKAVLDMANGYNDTIRLSGYSSDNAVMHMDVDVDNMSADKLVINGNVEGTTGLIVHASSDADIRNRGSIVFAQSGNDTTGNAASFEVARVYSSPYLYNVVYQNTGENANQWAFEMNNQKNPDYNDKLVTPEAIAYIGLQSAAVEQVRGLKDTVAAQTAACRYLGCQNDGQSNHNLWIDAGYTAASLDKPAEFDADIQGITAGGDLQYDASNQLGLFAAYRKGKYDFSGKGGRYYSTVGSEIDLDSYLGGLYYRYERNNWYAFATVYGGIQKADMKTDDGMVKTDSDGSLWGAGIEGGKRLALTKTLALEPALGVFYSGSKFDDIHDTAGKKAEFDTLSQFELEAGMKLEYSLCQNNLTSHVYIRPSLIQTITNGDEVKISGLKTTSAYHDQTLGRIELGARFGMTDGWSGFGWANYSFGSSYDATAFGLGLNYAW